MRYPRVSRQWFRIRDTYGVEVGPGEDDALVIAIAVCIDRIHEDEERKHHQQSPFGGGFGRLPAAGARHSTTSVIAFASSGSRTMLAARMFCSTCSGEPDPGIGRICGDLDNSQAIATCRGPTPCRLAAVWMGITSSAATSGAHGRNTSVY